MRTAALRRANEVNPITKRRSASLKVPFLDDTLMQGPPNYSEEDFETPRLRRCLFDLATVDWKSAICIDGGLDGYTWRVCFGKDGPYVLKVVGKITLGFAISSDLLLVLGCKPAELRDLLCRTTRSPERRSFTDVGGSGAAGHGGVWFYPG